MGARLGLHRLVRLAHRRDKSADAQGATDRGTDCGRHRDRVPAEDGPDALARRVSTIQICVLKIRLFHKQVDYPAPSAAQFWTLRTCLLGRLSLHFPRILL